MAGVFHAVYHSRSCYARLFSDCFCPFTLNRAFVAFCNVNEVSVLSGVKKKTSPFYILVIL